MKLTRFTLERVQKNKGPVSPELTWTFEIQHIAFGVSARFDLPRCQTAAWHGVAQHVEPPLWPGVSEVK